uniref:Sorting nexin 12 n=1 Tax=Pipistrellus kuhlii TaxID=59472 RepID=A0A7J7SGY8_PIPKU|nr:sorting nexin 12 [Pipistrellus kuhlii]
MSDTAVADTRRLNSKPQDLTDAYGPPSNFLEIDIFNPQTVGVGRARFTTYEVRMRTNLPIFKLKESCVRRRYSDFEWLKNELERDSKGGIWVWLYWLPGYWRDCLRRKWDPGSGMTQHQIHYHLSWTAYSPQIPQVHTFSRTSATGDQGSA